LISLGLQAIRLGVPIDDELHRFGFDQVGVLFRFLPRAGRDLLGGLPRGLKETVDLLPRLIEGVPDRRRRRSGYLELGNNAIDAFDIGIDRPSLVATNRNRKRDAEKIPRNVVSEAADLALRCWRRGRWLVRVRT